MIPASDKMIEFKVGELSEHLSYMHIYMNMLIMYCMMCKIKIDIGDFSFPPTKKEYEDFESWLLGTEVDKDIDEERMSCEYEQHMGDFFSNKPIKQILSLDMRSKDSFGSIIEICSFLSDALLLHIYYPDIITSKTSSYFLLYSNVAAGKVHELCGYWTAKMEERERNARGGAAVMKERGEENAKAIKKIIDELGIRSLSVFRQDKRLRDRFYNAAKAATCHGVPLSEDRISKIARAQLRGQGNGLTSKAEV